MSELKEIAATSVHRAAVFEVAEIRRDVPVTEPSSGGSSVRVSQEHSPSRPESLLMDELRFALNSVSTTRIEELKENHPIVIVIRSMRQFARASQCTTILHLDRIMESGWTEKMFLSPEDKRMQARITGRADFSHGAKRAA